MTYPRTFLGQTYPRKKRRANVVPLLATRVFVFDLVDEVTVDDPFNSANERFYTLVDTVTVTQAIGKVITIYETTINQTITVSDTTTATFPIKNFNITHTIDITDNAQRSATEYLFDLTDTINISNKIQRTYEPDIEDQIVIFDEAKSIREWKGKFADWLDATDSWTTTREKIKNLTDTLNLTESFGQGISTTRDVTEILTPTESWTSVLITINLQHPTNSGANIVYAGYVVMLGESAIILPTPEFDDTCYLNDEVKVKRSMNGRTHAYIKKAGSIILEYTWHIPYTKALELRDWYLKNNGRYVQIQNWKGEIWISRIITDVLEFEHLSKWQGTDHQKTEVTIRFEGNRLI